MNRLVLLVCRVFVFYPIGLCKFIFELRSEVCDIDAVFFCGLLALSFTGHSIGRKSCAATLQEFGHLNVERQSTLVNEGKRNVSFSTFIGKVLSFVYVGLFCHLCYRITHNLTQLLNSCCNLRKLHQSVVCVHVAVLLNHF